MYYLLEALLALSILLPVLATVSVALRFYARRYRKAPLLADDWLILVALVVTTATCAINFYAVFSLGLGNPPQTDTPEQVISSYKVLYATILMDYFTFGIIKISVILFYKRLFSVGRFSLFANTLLVVISAWTVAGIFAQAFASTPVSNFFTGDFTINWGALNIAMAVLDLFFDVLVLLLPLIAIGELQVTRKQKISIIGLFWLGAVCVISSAVRIYFNYEWSQLGPTSSLPWFQYVVSNTNLWLVVEGNVSVIAACMPALGGLLRMSAPKLATRYARGTKQSNMSSIGASAAVRSANRDMNSAGTDRSWIKLADSPSRGVAVPMANKGKSGDDNYGGIRVQTSFGSEYTLKHEDV